MCHWKKIVWYYTSLRVWYYMWLTKSVWYSISLRKYDTICMILCALPAIELNSSIAMRTFPKNIKHLNIVLRTLVSKIRNWKRAFRNFWKIGRRRFQIFEYSNFWKKSNEWTPYHRIHAQLSMGRGASAPRWSKTCNFVAIPYTANNTENSTPL